MLFVKFFFGFEETDIKGDDVMKHTSCRGKGLFCAPSRLWWWQKICVFPPILQRNEPFAEVLSELSCFQNWKFRNSFKGPSKPSCF